MFSEEDIEKLVQPIIDRQEAINNYVIEKIAKRIKEIGGLLPSDVYKLQRLLKTSQDVRDINKTLAEMTDLQEEDIKKLIKEVAQDAYIDVKPYYDYRHKSYIPFDENIALQRVIKAVEEQTLNTYRNMSKAQAFMIRDLKNPTKLKPTSIAKTYQTVVDEAIQSVQSGTIDYHTAMRRTLRELVDSGIRYVEYSPESGRRYTQRLDTAIRRNLLDGVRAINQGVQDEVGRQFGADGKEITVHANPAPDHEPIQGHQFTNEEFDRLQSEKSFEDVKGNKFGPIKRAIGTLNCRHFTYSIIVGFTKPNYNEEELKEIIKKNHKGYTDSKGNHYTMYECTQMQRMYETKIRRAKDGQMAAKAAGDMDLARKYQAKIDTYTKQYKAFSNACGLSVKMKKATVSGYTRINTI